MGDALARRATVNDTCLACHAELRGPFLWEHAPVVEDCGTCHVPHGSNQPALLARRAPQLCQGCHSSVGHRSFAQTPEDLAAGRAGAFLLANACLNCHFAVHGSNHPSGNLFRRLKGHIAFGILSAVAAAPIHADSVVTPNYDNVRHVPLALPAVSLRSRHRTTRDIGASGRWPWTKRKAVSVATTGWIMRGSGGTATWPSHTATARAATSTSKVRTSVATTGESACAQGRDESYDVVVHWRELPRNVSTDGRTPYTGHTTLTLPDTWASLGPDHLLAMQGRAVDNATRRRKGHAQLALMPMRNVRLQASYMREAKTGTAETYADRFYQATGLPKPIDYATEELGGEVAFTSQPWLIAATLRRSRFRNADASLAWQNAFSSRGDPTRIALAPDNGLDTLSVGITHKAWANAVQRPSELGASSPGRSAPADHSQRRARGGGPGRTRLRRART